MKRGWLLYLVIFSLALNVGIIGALAYLRWQDRQAAPLPPEAAPLPFRELMDKLQLDGQQRQALWCLAPEHRRKVQEFRRELAQRRQELFALMKQDSLPNWPPVQAKIREISDLQLRLEEEMVQHLLEVQKHLKPEQRQVLLTSLEQRLVHFWGVRGPHRGRRGLMPGSGQAPAPPSPPGAPGAK